MGNYEIRKGDNLYNIVKNEYKLTNKTDIMNQVYAVAKQNGIKNINLIHIGKNINLPEGLKLNSVSIMNTEQGTTQVLKDKTGNTNYYRANTVFGDIASKPEDYPDQNRVQSELKAITQATPEVEDVEINVRGLFTSETARDAQAYDIAAKPAGVGGFKEMNGTDAYKLFLKVNSDDFTVRESEYKGKVESKAYLDVTKSDGKITVFSSELVNGKEYLTMKDKDGNVHYFDKENNLSETKFD